MAPEYPTKEWLKWRHLYKQSLISGKSVFNPQVWKGRMSQYQSFLSYPHSSSAAVCHSVVAFSSFKWGDLLYEGALFLKVLYLQELPLYCSLFLSLCLPPSCFSYKAPFICSLSGVHLLALLSITQPPTPSPVARAAPTTPLITHVTCGEKCTRSGEGSIPQWREHLGFSSSPASPGFIKMPQLPTPRPVCLVL